MRKSQELLGEYSPASAAIDGNINTFWHTRWLGSSPALPHWLTVNLGTARAISGSRYLPRAVGSNGRIGSWRFHVSIDGVSWQLVSSDTFSGAAEQTNSLALAAITNRPPAMAAPPASGEDTVGVARRSRWLHRIRTAMR